MTNKPAYLITGNMIVIHTKSQTFTLHKGTPKGDQVVTLIKEQKWNELTDLLSPATLVPSRTKGLFHVDSDGELYTTGDDKPIHKVIGKKLLAFLQEGLPCEPLVNFWNNLKQNPSERSVDQLFQFLEANHHPLTDDGCFLAYKKVTRTATGLKDSHSRTFSNNVGEYVTMDRSGVNPDPNQTCSTGLHVASFEYAKGFSGDVLVVVKVNPRDVVAVPTDYNQQKMRTCAYFVEEIYDKEEEMKETYKKAANHTIVSTFQISQEEVNHLVKRIDKNAKRSVKTHDLAVQTTAKERTEMIQKGYNPLNPLDIAAFKVGGKASNDIAKLVGTLKIKKGVKSQVAKAVSVVKKAVKRTTTASTPVKAKSAPKKKEITLSTLTAAGIQDAVLLNFNSTEAAPISRLSLKNKQSILKKATALFVSKGWSVK